MGDFKRFQDAAAEKSGFRITDFTKESTPNTEKEFAPSPFMNTNDSSEPPEVAAAQEAEAEPEEEPPIDLEALQQEAYDLGAEDAKNQIQPQIDQLENQLELIQPMIQQMIHLRRESLEQAAKDIADIVLMVAKRVVGDSLAYNPDALPTLVQSAISQMPEEDEITIKVAQDDVACVKDALDEPFQRCVVASDSIEAGCIVETKFASIDSSLDAVATGLEAAVNEWLESQNA